MHPRVVWEVGCFAYSRVNGVLKRIDSCCDACTEHPLVHWRAALLSYAAAAAASLGMLQQTTTFLLCKL